MKFFIILNKRHREFGMIFTNLGEPSTLVLTAR